MKLQAHKIDAFVQQLPASCLGALVYGPDTGLVSERVAAITRGLLGHPIDPFLLVDISTDRLKETPSLLLDEMNAVSFASGRRVIKLREATHSHTALLKTTLEHPPADAAKFSFILVQAGDLSPGSLRTLFENTPHLAALPCYVEEGDALHRVIRERLAFHGLTADNDSVRLIGGRAHGDRMQVQQAIDKLALFLGKDSAVVTEEAVLACVGEGSESTLDDLCAAFASGRRQPLCVHLARAESQAVEPIVLLRALQRYLNRIQLVLGYMARGASPERALSQLRPPVFFKQVEPFKRSLARYKDTAGMRTLQNQLFALHKAEIACKQNTLSRPYLTLEQTLLALLEAPK